MNAYKQFTITGLLVILTGLQCVHAQQQNAKEKITLRQSLDLREGPGSYHNLVLKLYADAVVTKIGEENGWLNVTIDDYEGWIPNQQKYFDAPGKDQAAAQDSSSILQSNMALFYQQLADGKSGSGKNDSPYASPAQVAAAVKGFSRKFKTSRGSDTRIDFSPSLRNRINAKEYRRFRKSRISYYNWQTTKRYFPLRDTMPDITPDIETMGWAIANVIAQQGLYEDYDLQEYLTYAALVVTESSHRYEIPVQVHIMDTNDVVGYSTPNGIIFVSKGALKLIKNEAEYAFFIGHELAHIVLQHGITETKNRRVKIKSDEAFAELEDDMNYQERREDKYVQISNELTQWTDQVYDYVVKDKLDEYELEADFWGMIYAYRAGYNPAAGLALLKRFKENAGDFETTIGELKWQGTAINTRLNKYRETLATLQTDTRIHKDYQEIYQQKTRGLF